MGMTGCIAFARASQVSAIDRHIKASVDIFLVHSRWGIVRIGFSSRRNPSYGMGQLLRWHLREIIGAPGGFGERHRRASQSPEQLLTTMALFSPKRQQSTLVLLRFRIFPIISVLMQGKSAAAGFRFLIRNATQHRFRSCNGVVLPRLKQAGAGRLSVMPGGVYADRSSSP